MHIVMYLAGGLALALGVLVARTSMVTDIQIGIVVTALVGGMALIGLGAVLGRLGRLTRQMGKVAPVPDSEGGGRGVTWAIGGGLVGLAVVLGAASASGALRF